MGHMTLAIGLLSGGLDSTLAARLILEQGIRVHAVNFVSPFCTCTPKHAGCSAVATAIRQLGNIPLTTVALGDEYLEMVRHPKFGHGRNLNPCIDCRILKLRHAARLMREMGAAFLFTGEVLGQRPMSQHRRALEIIDRETGLEGLILRPLSAALLPPTEPEKQGLVDRSRLPSIRGRSRKPQLTLASEFSIRDFRCAGGGCLLTDTHFAARVRDLLAHEPAATVRDIPLLKIGRHFRLAGGIKVVVSRNKDEGDMLLRLSRADDLKLIPHNFPGPTTLIRGGEAPVALPILLSYVRHDLPEDAVIRVETEGVGPRLIPRRDFPAPHHPPAIGEPHDDP